MVSSTLECTKCQRSPTKLSRERVSDVTMGGVGLYLGMISEDRVGLSSVRVV